MDLRYGLAFANVIGMMKVMQKFKKPFLLGIVSICSYSLFLLAIVYFKRPICIDSKVVNKIDSIDLSGQAKSIYQCKYNKKTPYSLELMKRLETTVKNTESMNYLFESIKTLDEKIELTVTEKRPYAYEVTRHRIIIGDKLFNKTGYLQRALIESWLKQNRGEIKIDTHLLEQVLVDFVFYQYQSKFEIENPLSQFKTKLGPVRWPHVLKSEDNYCRSAWIWPEHIESCSLGQFQISDRDFNTTATLSLRPLLLYAWISSFNELNYNQKRTVLNSIPDLVSKMSLTSTQVVTALIDEANPIFAGIQNINKFSELVSSLPTYNEFLNQFNAKLDLLGVGDQASQAQLDILIEADQNFNSHSPMFKTIVESLGQSDKQVAIADRHFIWLLPSQTAIPVSMFSRVQAKWHLYLSCDGVVNEKKLNNFLDQSEKLIMIKKCGDTGQINFAGLKEENLNRFYLQNKKLNFVQLHLPSFKMVKTEMNLNQNIFDLVKNKNLEQKDLKALGWQAVDWNKDLNIFKPKAVIDAIEYFRN